jgi:hypothetical protein
MDKIHTEPEDDIAVVCLFSFYIHSSVFLTRIRIQRSMSQPFTAMTGNRKYYLFVYMQNISQYQGHYFDWLLALSGTRGEWPTVSNTKP